MIDIQNESDLKNPYYENDLLNFYNLYVSTEKFPKLLHRTKKNVAYFGSTYRCEQFFSSMKLTKTKFRSKLTGTNLKNQLRTAQSALNADVNKLASIKQYQISH